MAYYITRGDKSRQLPVGKKMQVLIGNICIVLKVNSKHDLLIFVSESRGLQGLVAGFMYSNDQIAKTSMINNVSALLVKCPNVNACELISLKNGGVRHSLQWQN